MDSFDRTRAVLFSVHADERAVERGISRSDVLYVLERPSKVEIGERGCRNVWGYTVAGKRIRVTIDVRANLVVTVSNADRGLR